MSQNAISERQQFWLDHVRAAVNGEQAQVEYARSQGLKAKDLYQWKTMLTRRGHTIDEQALSDFVSIQTTPSPSFSLVLANGVRVETSGPLDEQQIRALLTHASQIPY